MEDELFVSRDNGIMTLTMNRPQARNAMNANMAQLIATALDELDASDDLHVGILAGGGGTFCSGMDLKGFLKGELPTVKGRGFGGITECGPVKPLIAAVEGYALAGGFELAIACDLIVAARTAQFGIPEVKRGLVAAAGGLIKAPDQIAPRLAMELALTGEPIDAARAYEIGLINRLADEGQAIDGAQTLAAKIVVNGPLAVRTSKQVMQDYARWSHGTRWHEQAKQTQSVFESDDAREGALAFAEKRPPKWTGK